MTQRLVMNFVVLLGLTGSLFAADPLVGTWKLNVTKSKFAGPRRIREMTTVYQEKDGQLIGAITGISEDGSPFLFKYSVPSSGGTVYYSESPSAFEGYSTTLSPHKKGSRTTDWTTAHGGKVIDTQQDAVSSDGKTLTTTTRGKDAEGKPYESVWVAERQ
jgi:hypothetical protein